MWYTFAYNTLVLCKLYTLDCVGSESAYLNNQSVKKLRDITNSIIIKGKNNLANQVPTNIFVTAKGIFVLLGVS